MPSQNSNTVLWLQTLFSIQFEMETKLIWMQRVPTWTAVCQFWISAMISGSNSAMCLWYNRVPEPMGVPYSVTKYLNNRRNIYQQTRSIVTLVISWWYWHEEQKCWLTHCGPASNTSCLVKYRQEWLFLLVF